MRSIWLFLCRENKKLGSEFMQLQESLVWTKTVKNIEHNPLWIVTYKWHRPVALHNWFWYEDPSFVRHVCIWGHDDGRPRRKSMLLKEFFGELGPLLFTPAENQCWPCIPSSGPSSHNSDADMTKINKAVSVNCKCVSKDIYIYKYILKKKHAYQLSWLHVFLIRCASHMQISKGIWIEAHFIKTYDEMRNKSPKCLFRLATNPIVIISRMGNQRVNKCMPSILLWEVYARAVCSCCLPLLHFHLDDVISCTLGEDIPGQLPWSWILAKLVFEVENIIN